MLRKLPPRVLGGGTSASGYAFAHRTADEQNYQMYRCEGLKIRKNLMVLTAEIYENARQAV